MVSGCPQCSYASHMFVCLLYICMSQGCKPPHVPHIPVHLYVFRGFWMLGDCKGPPYMLNTSFTPPPVWGYLPFSLHPHSFVGFPVHCYVLRISLCHMGIFPLCLGLGVFPHLLEVYGGISIWDVHMLILVHFCSLICLTCSPEQ